VKHEVRLLEIKLDGVENSMVFGILAAKEIAKGYYNDIITPTNTQKKKSPNMSNSCHLPKEHVS
jgi:hypothetical protein